MTRYQLSTLRRENQAKRGRGESWRPIPCTDVSPVRRYFDLQAGSIWRDLARLLPRISGTLVDVGCGAQPYRRLLSRQTTYVGIDTVEAKSSFGYETPDTRYYDGRNWPVDDRSADAVLATETLEHITEPELFLAEAHRVLKPGGHLLLTVPFSARWHFIPVDFWRFTPAGLTHLFEKAGFVDAEIVARGNPLTVAAYKCLAVLSVFILPQSPSRLRSFALQGIGALVLPLFFAFAITGNLSFLLGGGDDCLGYTAIARRPLDDEQHACTRESLP